MSADTKLPERIERIIGSLPEAGRLLDSETYPFETVRPSIDGFIERDGVRAYYAVWGGGPELAKEGAGGIALCCK